MTPTLWVHWSDIAVDADRIVEGWSACIGEPFACGDCRDAR